MRVQHIKGYSIVQGKRSEYHRIIRWIDAAYCVIEVDESEDDEISFTVVSRSSNTTQVERQLDFQYAKKAL
jgi:hypothetical protein